MQNIRVLLVSTAFAMSSCIDKTGALTTVDGGGPPPAPDATEPRPADAGFDTDIGLPDGGGCEPGLQVGAVRSTEESTVVRFAVDGRDLWFEREFTEGLGGIWIHRLNPETRTEVPAVVGRAGRFRLLDARRGAVLYTELSLGTPQRQSVVWQSHNGRIVLPMITTPVFEPAVRDWIGEDVAFILQPTADRRQLRGMTIDGRRFARTSVIEATALQDGTIIRVTEDGAEWRLIVDTVDETSVVQRLSPVLATQTLRPPRETNVGLWWQQGDGVWRTDLTGRPIRVAPGCDLFDASGSVALAGCDRVQNAPMPAYRRLVWWFDSFDEPIDVPDIEGVVTNARVLDETRIVWTEYRDPMVLCGGSSEGVGRVRSWLVGTRTFAINLDTVRAPCLCCDIDAAPPLLDGLGTIAAWNYSQDDADRSLEGPIGYAAWVDCADRAQGP